MVQPSSSASPHQPSPKHRDSSLPVLSTQDLWTPATYMSVSALGIGTSPGSVQDQPGRQAVRQPIQLSHLGSDLGQNPTVQVHFQGLAVEARSIWSQMVLCPRRQVHTQILLDTPAHLSEGTELGGSTLKTMNLMFSDRFGFKTNWKEAQSSHRPHAASAVVNISHL